MKYPIIKRRGRNCYLMDGFPKTIRTCFLKAGPSLGPMAEALILSGARRRQQGPLFLKHALIKTRYPLATAGALDQKPDSRVASPAGLEPATLCLEGRCA
jgi:hypothetical protein